MQVFRIFATIAAVTLFGSTAMADTLTIRGSTTVVENVFKANKAAIESKTGLDLDVVGNGSTQGVMDVQSGAADIGMISAPLEATVAKAAKKNASFDGSALKAHQVGEARVAFIKHKDNPVASLTMDQVAGILSGDIKNWSEVGGSNAPIVVIVEKSGGVRSMTEKAVLSGAKISANTRPMPVGSQVPKVVAQMKPAFGISSAAFVSAKTPEIETGEKIAQPLILVTVGDPSPESAKVIAAASAIAQ